MQGGHLYCVAPVLSTDLVFLCYRSCSITPFREAEPVEPSTYPFG